MVYRGARDATTIPLVGLVFFTSAASRCAAASGKAEAHFAVDLVGDICRSIRPPDVPYRLSHAGDQRLVGMIRKVNLRAAARTSKLSIFCYRPQREKKSVITSKTRNRLLENLAGVNRLTHRQDSPYTWRSQCITLMLAFMAIKARRNDPPWAQCEH